jgi:hypothetical protein
VRTEHLPPSRGRAGAQCQPFDWSVSPARPPNRTCTSLCIRLSTSSDQTGCGAPSNGVLNHGEGMFDDR